MEYFENNGNAGIVLRIVGAIQANKVLLSDIDGEIGDGDHGINMNKGFTMAGRQIAAGDSFSDAMKTVGDTLLLEIGGSMGPIYGTFFRKCAKAVKGHDRVDAPLFGRMLESALEGVADIGGAKAGDKTLIDTLEPAVRAFARAVDAGEGFRESLDGSLAAALEGKESTRAMMARIGRAARLGERSVGALDAGAASCYIILDAMFGGVREVIRN